MSVHGPAVDARSLFVQTRDGLRSRFRSQSEHVGVVPWHTTRYAAVRVPMRESRRVPVGAEVRSDGVHFRVWAPCRQSVEVVGPEGFRASLHREEGGYFSGASDQLGDGSRYAFSLDGGDPVPDPASRFQPEGPDGWSEVVDPDRFAWSDADWGGISPTGQVIYEIHVGTFTPEGTFDPAARHLVYLRDL